MYQGKRGSQICHRTNEQIQDWLKESANYDQDESEMTEVICADPSDAGAAVLGKREKAKKRVEKARGKDDSRRGSMMRRREMK